MSDSLVLTCYDYSPAARGQPLGRLELPFSIILEIAQGTTQWYPPLPSRRCPLLLLLLLLVWWLRRW